VILLALASLTFELASLSITGRRLWNRRNKSWQSIAMSSDGRYLAAVVSGGHLYTSSDWGASWAAQTSAGNKHWYSIAMSSDGRYLAAVVDSGHIYTSSDYGANWKDRSE